MAIFPASAPRPDARIVAAIVAIITVAMFGLLAPAHAGSLDEINRLIRAGDHAGALEQVDRYLAGKPQDAQGRFVKGVILTGMNRQNEAIAIFRKLTQDHPDLPEPHNNLAVIYAQQKQYDKAKEELEKAIRTHPAYATAHENLGDIYSRLASQAYGKALQIDSSNTSAQTKLAMISDLVGTVKPPAPVVIAAAPVVPSLPAKAAEPAPVKPAPVVETKPAPVTPVPPPAKPEPAPAANLDAEIATAVDAWLAAWSKKDVKAYLARYADDFETPHGKSRKAWEAERTQRIGKPGKIEVSRDKLSIKAEGSDKAVVRFRQAYRSAGFNSLSGKTLVMVRQGGKWLIQQERVGG